MMVASWSSRDMPSNVSKGNFDGIGGTETRGAKGAVECGMTLTWARATSYQFTSCAKIPSLVYSGSLGAWCPLPGLSDVIFWGSGRWEISLPSTVTEVIPYLQCFLTQPCRQTVKCCRSAIMMSDLNYLVCDPTVKCYSHSFQVRRLHMQVPEQYLADSSSRVGLRRQLQMAISIRLVCFLSRFRWGFIYFTP